jgi:predicted transcriptional regulator of viral defense system
MITDSTSQRERIISLLAQKGMVRLAEFKKQGITAAAVSRLAKEGSITRLGRGLYQLPDAEVSVHHDLAEAIKRVPRGVICLVSALAFHGLTDRIPAQVWMAIGRKDWRPRIEYTPTEFVRFSPEHLTNGVDVHIIEGVEVAISNPARTVVDLFRYRRRLGLNVAMEGLREALRQHKATPAEIADYAAKGRVWKVLQPYLEAMTSNA